MCSIMVHIKDLIQERTSNDRIIYFEFEVNYFTSRLNMAITPTYFLANLFDHWFQDWKLNKTLEKRL